MIEGSTAALAAASAAAAAHHLRAPVAAHSWPYPNHYSPSTAVSAAEQPLPGSNGSNVEAAAAAMDPAASAAAAHPFFASSQEASRYYQMQYESVAASQGEIGL